VAMNGFHEWKTRLNVQNVATYEVLKFIKISKKERERGNLKQKGERENV
jgi:hypothetical protein